MPDIARNPHYTVDTMSPQKARIFDHSPDRDWLNPISMSTLKRAVERKDNTVYLNGVQYSISYDHWLDLPLTGKRELIKLERVDGEFAPFGYVSVQRLQQFQFEGGS